MTQIRLANDIQKFKGLLMQKGYEMNFSKN